jgi:hypothetical protein
MLELLQRLVALNENRDSATNEINWDYVDADAYHLTRGLYETDDAFYTAFNAAADQISDK